MKERTRRVRRSTRTRKPARRWTLVPHTADLAVALAAPTLADLFGAAAAALLAVTTGGPERVAARQRGAARRPVAIEVRGASLEDLLVRWLQEILFLQESRGWRFHSARVTAIDRRRLALRGEASGEPYDATRHPAGREVKAVTYHRLAIRRRASTWRARVVFDV